MARNVTKTYILIDANGKPAAGELQRVEDAAKDTDEAVEDIGAGGMPGLQAGLDGAIGKLGALAGPAGVGALVGGLISAGDKAADLAIEAGTVASTLDISVEEASRLTAAFGDVEIEANDLVDIALQVTGALEDSPALAQALGLEIGKAIEPVDALEAGIDNWNFLDATTRAQLFGEEGVRQLGRLAAEGESLEDILAGIDDTRIVDDQAVEDALEYKAAMAEIAGAWDSVAIYIGQSVVPLMTDVLGLAVAIKDALQFEDVLPWQESLDNAAADRKAWQETEIAKRQAQDETAEGARINAERTADYRREQIAGSQRIVNSWEEQETAAEATARKVEETMDRSKAAMERFRGVLSIDEQTAQINAKLEEMGDEFDATSVEGQADMRDLSAAALDLAEDLDATSVERTARILLAYEQGDIDALEAELDALERLRIVRVEVREFFRPGGGGGESPYVPIPQSTSNTTQNINVTMPRTANPRELTATLDTWKRANG